MRRPLNVPEGFEMVCRGGLDWIVRAGAADPVLDRILDAPDIALAASEVLKRGRSATVGRLRPWVVKRFAQKRPWNALFDRFRPDRARRNLVVARALGELGVATPAVAAAARRLELGLVTCAWLVTAELAGARTLLASLDGDPPSAALEALGAALARIHDAGWSHRDLKASNVMIDDLARVHLVDLDGLRRRRPDARRRAADLGRLFRDLARAPARAAAWKSAVLDGYRPDAAVFAALGTK